ncbi:MAG: hypothetical protein J7M34_02560 [Anaerolineae bacterium]|nr:hypothetical protein [Anaerolineae bacterium]
MMPWHTLITLAAVSVALFYLSDWIGRHIQGIGLLLTGRAEGGMALAWLLFLPGIVLHEASHWAVARLLGLRPSPPHVWPERRGNSVRMGYVDFRSGGPLRDSLVGLAPLITGCLLLLWFAVQVFGLEAQSGWQGVIQRLRQGLDHPDIWLYIYLIFTISNGMMPSASDREAWGSLLLYMLMIGGGLYALGLVPSISPQRIASVLNGAQVFAYALVLATAIDVPIALAIGTVELAIGLIKQQRVSY